MYGFLVLLLQTKPAFAQTEDSKNKQLRQAVDKLESLQQSQDRVLEDIRRLLANKPEPQPLQSGEVLFERQVQRILQNRCAGCHNPKLANNALDITTREALIEGGIKGAAIEPGHPETSLLYLSMAHKQKPYMPYEMDKIPEEEIQIVADWIRAGAPFTNPVPLPIKNSTPEKSNTRKQSAPKHWAYIPPQQPALPSVKNREWCRNPMDAFILSKLEEKGFHPTQQAGRETLIRRLSLDLTGLPPTPVEVERFVEDESPAAYSRLVNRLLASPHFGERWATQWLDLARYADSNGYEKDRQREMWAYREWVIDAFNRDMPYDQFTIEQIAGDLLPGSNLQQKIATGFQRNTMINEEGGVNQEEYRVAAVIDRTNTTATVWLGSTLACAQCHDHKYDPFTQKDYYRLFAFFNNTKKEINQVESFEAYSDGPLVHVPTPEQQKTIDRIQPQVDRLRSQLYRKSKQLDQAQQEWEQKAIQEANEWTVLETRSAVSVQGATLTVLHDGSILASGINPTTDTYVIETVTAQKKISGIRLEVMPDKSLPQNGPGRRSRSRFSLSELKVSVLGDSGTSNSDQKQPTAITLTKPSANWESGSSKIANVLDGKDKSGWSNGALNSRHFEAVFLTPTMPNDQDSVHLQFVLKQMKGAGENIGRLRLSVTSDPHPKANPIPRRLFDAFSTSNKEQSKKIRKEIQRYFRDTTPLLKSLRNQIAQLESQLPKNMPETLVLEERETPRQSHILIKGNYKNQGEAVEPGVPALFPQIPTDQQANRLDLARWLMSEKNPLAARVAVNRVWEQLFGYGIVKTTEDFGTRGQPPVNQELLDWLAIRYVEDGWSLKSLLYLMVTSSTYRQSSAGSPDLFAADPENRYLARGPRFRLRAEFIRDTGLAASGLLNKKIGGPSVFPYQPEGIWRMPYSSAKWVMSKHGDQYRRGLYTHWQRTAPYPTFINFDAPSREVTCTRRIRTNTPLQALNLLNDPAFFDMARGLALRMIHETVGDIEDRLQYGFRICTARYADEKEIQQLKSFYQDTYRYYQAHPKETIQVIQKENIDDDTDIFEHASWILTANILLNLDETMTKG